MDQNRVKENARAQVSSVMISGHNCKTRRGELKRKGHLPDWSPVRVVSRVDLVTFLLFSTGRDFVLFTFYTLGFYGTVGHKIFPARLGRKQECETD
jgi:hypothetical protein